MNRIEVIRDRDGDLVTNVWLDGKQSRLIGSFGENQAFAIIRQWRKDAERIKHVQH